MALVKKYIFSSVGMAYGMTTLPLLNETVNLSLLVQSDKD